MMLTRFSGPDGALSANSSRSFLRRLLSGTYKVAMTAPEWR